MSSFPSLPLRPPTLGKRRGPVVRFTGLLLLLAALLPAAQGAAPVPKLKELVEGVKAALEKESITDPRGDLPALRALPAFQALEKETPASAEIILKNIDELAPDTTEQAIVFSALESVPPELYARTVGVAYELYLSAKMTETLFVSLLSTTGPKWGFLEINYQEPEINRLLNKIKGTLGEDAVVVTMLTTILSGDGKKAVEESIKENPDYAGRSVEALVLKAPQNQPMENKPPEIKMAESTPPASSAPESKGPVTKPAASKTPASKPR